MKTRRAWPLTIGIACCLFSVFCSLWAQAADQRIQYNEYKVGAGHPTKSDTLNRLVVGINNFRLALSGGNLTLAPIGGNLIDINGTIQAYTTMPTLAPAAFTPGIRYYVYLYDNAGTATLEASATGFTMDSKGRANKTGDTTRRLVGLATCITGPAWDNLQSEVPGYRATTLPFLDPADFPGANTGAQLQAAHDSSTCPSAGCAILLKDSSSTRTLSAVTITKDVHLKFGCGTYSQVGTFLVDNADPVIEMPTCAHFIWAGIATVPAWDLHGMGQYGGRIRGLKIAASHTYPLLEAFRIIHFAGDTKVSTNQILENVDVQCTLGTLGSCRFGIHWDSPNGVDANNDLFQGTNVKLYNYGGGPGIVVHYVGAGTAATMTNTGRVLSTSVTGAADNFSLDLSNASYDTLGELCTYIDGLAAYTCALGAGPWTTSSTISRELSKVDGEDIKTAHYTVNLFSAGFFVEGTQSHAHRCKGCIADGNQVQGTSGVMLGSYRAAAEGWHMVDGNPNANDMDLNCYNCSGRISWIGNNTEGSKRMIAGTGTSLEITVERNRWASTRLTPSKRAINLVGSGSLVLTGNRIDGYRSASKSVTGAVNNGAGLIRLTITGHGLATNDPLIIENVAGTTEANGFWVATVVDVNTVDLIGSTFTNAYTSGGTVWLDTLELYCQLSPDDAGARGGGCVSGGGNLITSPSLQPLTPAGWWRSNGGDISISPTDTVRGGNTRSFGQGSISFVNGDTTPDVRGGNLFSTANTAAKTITAFRNMAAGQTFTVWVNDANTTLGCSATGTLKCNHGVDVVYASGDVFMCTAYSTTLALCR